MLCTIFINWISTGTLFYAYWLLIAKLFFEDGDNTSYTIGFFLIFLYIALLSVVFIISMAAAPKNV